MTAIFRFSGRGRQICCRPVQSRALGSPSSGPYGAPGPLETLLVSFVYRIVLYRKLSYLTKVAPCWKVWLLRIRLWVDDHIGFFLYMDIEMGSVFRIVRPVKSWRQD